MPLNFGLQQPSTEMTRSRKAPLGAKPSPCIGRVFSPICVVAILSTGCRGGLTFAARACDSAAPLDLTADRRDSLRPINEAMHPDAQWARLARTAPGGLAGAYFEQVPRDARGQPIRQPRVVIRLAHPDHRAAALHALLPSLPAMFGGLMVDSADVLVVPAKWDFAQLDEWRRYLDIRVASVEITSVDNDEVSNQIRYGVTDAAARTALEHRLRDLRVPCGLVAIDIVGTARPGWE